MAASKQNKSPKGLFKVIMKLYDLHCHVLYGVDDASKTLQQSMDMIHVAFLDGIRVIAASSHIKPPLYCNIKEKLEASVKVLQKEIDAKGYDVKIVLAAENYVSHYTMHMLEEGKFIPYGNSKYILVEFPWTINIKDNPTAYLKRFISYGYKPVIAHPERYEWIHKDYNLLLKWKDMGCLLQINRTSIFGLDKIKESNMIVQRMLEDDLVDLVASDAHCCYAPRLPKLSDAYRYIEKKYGKTRAERYFVDVPLQILNETK